MNELKATFALEEQEPIRATFKINLMPYKLSQFENDMGFVKKDEVIIPDIDLSNLATKDELIQGLDNKQDTLTAGENITIKNGVISASGGGTVDLGNYYNKGEVDDLLENKLENQSNFKNGLSIGKDNTESGTATIIGFRNTSEAPNTILIGSDNSTIGSNSVCIGEWCDAGGNNSICIGNGACTAEQNSIQFGEGFNTTPNSFQVGEHQLLNIETGKIPFERLPDGIGGAEIDTSNLATKTDVANKQDKFATALPLELGGLKTSTTNISYDNNGRAYLNDKAFWASIPELLPSIVGENRNENASFEDSMSTAERAELRFLKLKGFNSVYPQLNLDGYNAIIRNFTVDDIVMADKVNNTVQMCFGKLENDFTFTPRLICRLQGSSSDNYKFAKMMYLYEPSYTSLNTSSGAWDGNYYMEYGESESFKTISYKRSNELGGIDTFYGVKLIEKDGAYSLAWVTESGEIVEPSGSSTFDELDFNCVIFNAYTFELPKADAGIYGFNPNKYFVANGTIDNVVVRMTDGTGFKALGLNYKEDEFEVVDNKLSLKTKIQPITEAEFEALETKEENTLYLIEE